MILVRAFFKWHELDEKKAFEFCNSFLINGMPNIPEEKRIEVLNKDHLKGITYEELMKQVKENE